MLQHYRHFACYRRQTHHQKLRFWEHAMEMARMPRFWWFGQRGDVPSAGARLQKLQSEAAQRYTLAARKRLVCAHPATSSRERCLGPMGNFRDMCSACRVEPEVVLRDHCLGLISNTGKATPACSVGRPCSACTGVDGRKLAPGQVRINNWSRASTKEPCFGGCKEGTRTTAACQTAHLRCRGDKQKELANCVYRAGLSPPKKRARQE
jgi:hypothetical protein